MYKSNLNCNALREQLDFLIKNNLVEERILTKQRVVYALSQKGQSVLRTFREVKQVFKIDEEQKQRAPLLF
jgi:predicted transcriptional regulator